MSESNCPLEGEGSKPEPSNPEKSIKEELPPGLISNCATEANDNRIDKLKSRIFFIRKAFNILDTNDLPYCRKESIYLQPNF
ncbi:MAG: hypothetical protein AAFO82_01155 [Bacteroidota bacterium]